MAITLDGAVLGNQAVMFALLRHLQAKGIISDQEWTNVLNDALRQARSHEKSDELISYIQTLAGSASLTG